MAEKKHRADVLSSGELSAFCAQIAMILKAGVGIGEGLAIMRDDMHGAHGRAVMEGLQRTVDEGRPLHIAMVEAGCFPKYVVDMTEIGETTGRLDEVMDSLSVYYEREESIARSIRGAVTYPLVMVGMMLVVVGVLIIKVLPIFNQVFQQLGSELTGFSRSLMALGTLIGRYSYVFVGAVAVLVAAGLLLRYTAGGRRRLVRWSASFFATRRLNAMIASGRFASAMSLMLASGLDTDQALDMVYKLVDNEYLRGRIERCKLSIEQGVGFADALVGADIFTGIYARMVNIGFRTGAADTVMRRLADRYEDEVDAGISGIIAVLEPTLVAVLSIVVGMILLSVMLPLMGIMATI